MSNDKALTIRYPATANLMIDSKDRDENVYSSPWNFQINKPNALVSGFFSRIGTTEVVLEWCGDNISDTRANREIIVDISGVGANVAQVSNENILIPSGTYNVAQCLNALIWGLNDLSGLTGGMIWEINQTQGGTRIQTVGAQQGFIEIVPTTLSELLDLTTGEALELYAEIFCPDLRPYRYLDFVSSQLTYAQDVKDASTAPFVRDVLCRWYFTEDNPEPLDQYGFPILMGYTRFVRRRIFNPPKQIKWDNNLNVGNLSFQVYGDDGILLTTTLLDLKSNFLMTLQLSES